MRPATGWNRRSIGLTAAMVSATPKLPAPSSSFAYTGRITSSIPIDMHIANSASTVRTKGFVRTRSGMHDHDPSRSSRSRLSTGTVCAEPNLCPMSTNEAVLRAQSRREAAPAAVAVLIVLVALAVVSRSQLWELLGLPWWIWLVLGIPALLLAIDLLLAFRGKGLARSRNAALVLLGLLVVGNFVALGILVAGLVTASTSDLTGGELLLTGFAIYTSDVVVFGLIFWEIEAGGPVARQLAPERGALDFRFPQDDSPVGTVEAAGLGLPLRLPDELDRVQPDRHHAALSASESC